MAWTQKTKPSLSSSQKRAARRTSTPKKTNSGRAGSGGVNSPASRVAARVRATPKATQTSQSNKPARRVATPIKSKAVTTPNTDNKIVTSSTPAAKANVVNSPAAKGNTIERNRTYSTPKAKQATPNITKINQDAKQATNSGIELESKRLLGESGKLTQAIANKGIDKPEEKGFFSSLKDAASLLFDDPRKEESGRYNQKYWADKLAKGKADGNDDIQGDLKREMDSIGKKKAYSGDKVITEDMKRKASDDLSRITGSMAVLDESGDPEMTAAKKADLTKAGILVGGVTKTKEQSGLFGEKLDTTYNYKGGPSIVTRATDPTIKGVRLGDKTSTTFVNGVEVATKTGSDPLGRDAKVTRPKGVAKGINDRVEAGPDPIKEISDIDNQIKTETDPGKLKALYKRRLMLMRLNQTNTRFAGLLGDADTKRTNLMSIG